MSQAQQPLITLTEASLQHVKKCIERRSEGAGFRLAVKKSGCTGYAYVPEIVESPKPDDFHFQQDGISIYVSAEAAPIVQGTVLDYEDTGLGQKQMTFKNPNEAASCGCGESFDVKRGDDA